VPAIDVRHLGEFIREQRETAKISLRELAKSAGVSNPYLSQIERGLRKPSAEILQQIAKGLRISAEALYVQAGILDQREASPVVDAVLADETLTERQKHVLLEIHDSFRKENAAAAAAAAPVVETAPAPAPAAPVSKAARKQAVSKKAAPKKAAPKKAAPKKAAAEPDPAQA
jgi:transcriptional regulator with XRE-family HTH domain